MNDFPTEGPLADLPATAQGCRDRLSVLHDEMAAIRIQIATGDLRRQAERKALDPDRYHRASTALRFKRREVARLQDELGRLGGGARRETFKDTLIDVLRADYDDHAWARALAQARRATLEREVLHG